MTMTVEQSKIAFTLISNQHNMEDVVEGAKHLADLHNRRHTEKEHSEKLVENYRKQKFSTLISSQDFMTLYYSFK